MPPKGKGEAPTERPLLGRFSSHLKIGIVSNPSLTSHGLTTNLRSVDAPVLLMGNKGLWAAAGFSLTQFRLWKGTGIWIFSARVANVSVSWYSSAHSCGGRFLAHRALARFTALASSGREPGLCSALRKCRTVELAWLVREGSPFCDRRYWLLSFPGREERQGVVYVLAAFMPLASSEMEAGLCCTIR